jgi:hypothetical protein
MRRVILAVLILLTFGSILGFSEFSMNKANNQEEGFKSVHLINLNSDASENEFVMILGEYNKVIAELGFPAIKYQLWKDRGDENKDRKYQYFFESKWPNQKTYDKVHEAKKYKALGEKYGKLWEEILQDHVSTRYISLN